MKALLHSMVWNILGDYVCNFVPYIQKLVFGLYTVNMVIFAGVKFCKNVGKTFQEGP